MSLAFRDIQTVADVCGWHPSNLTNSSALHLVTAEFLHNSISPFHIDVAQLPDVRMSQQSVACHGSRTHNEHYLATARRTINDGPSPMTLQLLVLTNIIGTGDKIYVFITDVHANFEIVNGTHTRRLMYNGNASSVSRATGFGMMMHSFVRLENNNKDGYSLFNLSVTILNSSLVTLSEFHLLDAMLEEPLTLTMDALYMAIEAFLICGVAMNDTTILVENNTLVVRAYEAESLIRTLPKLNISMEYALLVPSLVLHFFNVTSIVVAQEPRRSCLPLRARNFETLARDGFNTSTIRESIAQESAIYATQVGTRMVIRNCSIEFERRLSASRRRTHQLPWIFRRFQQRPDVSVFQVPAYTLAQSGVRRPVKWNIIC